MKNPFPIPIILLLTLVNGQTTTTTRNGCLTSNRLCINQAQIQPTGPGSTAAGSEGAANSLTLYFPSSVIPQDIALSSLSVDLYQGTDVVLLPDPCSTTRLGGATPIATSTLSNPQLVSSTVSAGSITFSFTQQQATNLLNIINSTNNAFFMRMADPNRRQCLLGPDILGAYADSISMDIAKLRLIANPSTAPSTVASSTLTSLASSSTSTSTNGIIPTTTSSTAAAASTSTTSSDNSSSSSDSATFIRILVLCVVGGFVLISTLLACFLWAKRSRSRKEDKEKDEPEAHYPSEEVATRRNESEEAIRLPSFSSIQRQEDLSPFPYTDREDILPIDTYMAPNGSTVGFSENLLMSLKTGSSVYFTPDSSLNRASLSFHTPVSISSKHISSQSTSSSTNPVLSDTNTLQGSTSHEDLKTAADLRIGHSLTHTGELLSTK